MMRYGYIVAIALAVACRAQSHQQEVVRHYALGRPATPAEIAAENVDVGPDGAGLPAGSGTAAGGEVIYRQQCASCHGIHGEGQPPTYPRLIGRDPRAEGFPFGRDPTLEKTIGNYWPFATTVFDYVRRAMPFNAPGSLTNQQVYAVTAFLLAANRVIADTTTLDSATLTAVKMPYANRFVPDNRRGGREVR